MIRLFLSHKIFSIFLFLLFTGTCSHAQAPESKWLFKTRIQQGIEYDDNIEESRDAPQADGLIKFVIDSRAKRYHHTSLLQLSYHGGIQVYLRTPPENKQSHDFSASMVYQISRRIRLGSRLWARIKYFNSRDWHYTLSHVEPFFMIDVTLFQLSCAFKLEGLNYLNYDEYDFKAPQVILTLQKQFKNHLSAQLRICRQSIRYNRYALYYDPLFDEALFSDRRQEDRNVYWALRGSYQNHFLASWEYLYQKNSSNSYGFSYLHHRVTFSAATPLRKGILLRMFAGWQQKRYQQSLDKIIWTELDAEREMSNFLILDFSKDISDGLSLLVRFSWYDNESPVPGRYYRKQLSSCSLEYRF